MSIPDLFTTEDLFLEIIEEVFDADDKCCATHLNADQQGFPCLITPVAKMWWCTESKFRPVCLNMVRYRDKYADRLLCLDCHEKIGNCWDIIPL